MATRYKCPNLGNCEKADRGEIIVLPSGAPLKCPDCAATLMPSQVGGSNGAGAKVIGILIGLLLLAIVGGGLWFFLRGEPDQPSGPAATPKSAAAQTLLRFHGSNTIGGKLLPALATAFLEEQGYANIRQVPGAREEESLIIGQRAGTTGQIEIQAHGSGTAFKDLKDGLCDIGMSSRKIKPAEQEELLPVLGDLSSNAGEHVLALDGIAIIVHPGNPVRSLSLAQVAGIFSGSITDWAQAGGRSGPIAIHARDDQSGTYDYFKEAVLTAQGKSLSPDARRYEDSEQLSAAVTGDPGGIGFIGLNYIGSNKVVALSDSGVEPRKPSLLTVKTEDYLLSRRLYLYTPVEPANPNVPKFIEFALGSPAQPVIAAVGLVNMNLEPLAAEPGDARAKSVPWRALTKGATEIPTRFRFRTGSADLDTRAQRDIGRIVGILSQPKYQQKSVLLIGFADSSGSHELNCRLSRERAAVLKTELATEGLTITKVEGLCDDAPVAPNDTAEGKEKNRRVEVWLR